MVELNPSILQLSNRNLSFLIAGVLILSSCKDKPTSPDIGNDGNGNGNGNNNGNGNDIYTPTAILEIDPAEGYAPLEVTFQCSGDHPQGTENIDKYVLYTGINEIESDSTINFTESFQTYGEFSAICTVYSGEELDSTEETVSVYDPGRPKASLDIDKKEGRVPHKTTVSVSGDHPESFDITEYHVKVNGEKSTSQSPIEESYTFTQTGESEILGWVTDSNGANSDTLRAYVNLEEIVASLSLTGNGEYPVDLKYTASVGNASDFTMQIYRDDESEPLITQTVSGDFEGVFDYQNHGITKGNYTAVLEPVDPELHQEQNLNRQKSANVPNYDPQFDSSDLSFEMDEEGQVIKNLESRISDPNPEDAPYISNAASLDGKTRVSVDGNNSVVIEGNEDQHGDFNIQKEISDGHGGITTATIPGYIHPLARVSGIVRNVENENLAGKKSKIEIYDENWNPIETKTENENGFSLTDNQGNFNIKLNKRASGLELLVVQAAHGTPNNQLGYVRTETIPGDLANPESPNYNPNIEMMAVPFYPYINNPEEFQQFFKQFGSPNKFDFDGRYLGNLGHPDLEGFNGLERIRVLSHDPCTDGEFTLEKQEEIKSNILDPNDINAIVGNYKIKEDIIVLGNGSGDDYKVNCEANDFSLSVLAKPGVLLYVPREPKHIEGRAGRAIRSQLAGIGYAGTIMGAPWGSGALWSHETGHIFLTSPHPTALDNTESVMPKDFNSQTTLRADHKAGRIIYYEFKFDDKRWSHFVMNDRGFPEWEMPTENILGLESGPENKTIHKNGKYWHGN